MIELEGCELLAAEIVETPSKTVTIANVREEKQGWEISESDNPWFWVSKKYKIVPKVGMTAIFYNDGMTFVRGLVFVDAEHRRWCVFYRDPEAQAAENKRQLELDVAKRKHKFERQKETLDKQYARLPEVFQRRLDKFRRNNPDFRWEFEAYEMFTCREAVRIANKFKKDPHELELLVEKKNWHELLHARMKFPKGHSGNTFGIAVFLARLYLNEPEGVVKLHGAMAPLVGSAEYGCIPRDEAKTVN